MRQGLSVCLAKQLHQQKWTKFVIEKDSYMTPQMPRIPHNRYKNECLSCHMAQPPRGKYFFLFSRVTYSIQQRHQRSYAYTLITVLLKAHIQQQDLKLYYTHSCSRGLTAMLYRMRRRWCCLNKLCAAERMGERARACSPSSHDGARYTPRCVRHIRRHLNREDILSL